MSGNSMQQCTHVDSFSPALESNRKNSIRALYYCSSGHILLLREFMREVLPGEYYLWMSQTYQERCSVQPLVVLVKGQRQQRRRQWQSFACLISLASCQALCTRADERRFCAVGICSTEALQDVPLNSSQRPSSNGTSSDDNDTGAPAPAAALPPSAIGTGRPSSFTKPAISTGENLSLTLTRALHVRNTCMWCCTLQPQWVPAYAAPQPLRTFSAA